MLGPFLQGGDPALPWESVPEGTGHEGQDHQPTPHVNHGDDVENHTKHHANDRRERYDHDKNRNLVASHEGSQIAQLSHPLVWRYIYDRDWSHMGQHAVPPLDKPRAYP